MEPHGPGCYLATLCLPSLLLSSERAVIFSWKPKFYRALGTRYSMSGFGHVDVNVMSIVKKNWAWNFML